MIRPDAITLAERADRPESTTGKCKYLFQDELVEFGWNRHDAGWWVWDDGYNMPVFCVYYKSEAEALESVAKWVEKFSK